MVPAEVNRAPDRAPDRVLPLLVATDLDGTLLDPEGRLSERARQVLDALDARGIPVGFTTGRPLRWMTSLWAAVGGHGLAVCSNGAIVYDVEADRVRDIHPLPRDNALRVARVLRERIPGVTFAIEHSEGWASEVDFPGHPDDRTGKHRGRFEEIYRDDVAKLLAVHREREPEEFWAEVERLVGDVVTTTWSSSYALVEMSGLGVTKATSLARLATELGVAPEEVVAFGDMPNDLPMLGWAGTSYAVANAHASVLETADHVVPGNAEDGVAVTLGEIFGL